MLTLVLAVAVVLYVAYLSSEWVEIRSYKERPVRPSTHNPSVTTFSSLIVDEALTNRIWEQAIELQRQTWPEDFAIHAFAWTSHGEIFVDPVQGYAKSEQFCEAAANGWSPKVVGWYDNPSEAEMMAIASIAEQYAEEQDLPEGW